MSGVKVVFRSLAVILILLGCASLYLYFVKDAGTLISAVASFIMAFAMIFFGNNIAAKMEKKE
jgi:uncharacterized membrane protein YjjB (DUF3815 family)